LAWQQGLTEIQSMFDALKKIDGPKTVDSFLKPFHELQILMSRHFNITHIYPNVHPDSDVRTIAADYEQKISKINTEISLSPEIYASLNAIDLSDQDEKTRFYVTKLIKEFKRAGLDKDEQTREKISKLQDELVKLGQEFERNIREDVRYIRLESADELAGLPQDYIDVHQPDSTGKIRISTDYPEFNPYMTYAKNDARRKELYRAYRSRGYPQSTAVLETFFVKRYELAQLLGYKTYASYDTENKMVETAEAAEKFIKRVTNIAKIKATKEKVELLARLQKEQQNASELGSWQSSYIRNLVRKEQYNFDSQQIRQYFPYETVLQGLFEILSQMYSVSFKDADVTVWHESVEAYELWDGDELLGRFYLDMHSRENKFKHAMMTEIVTGIKDRQLPEGALICNFPGGDGSLGLMEHSEVRTLFHEFGHLMHYLFAGKQPWIGISGISTEWDFVETPAKLFEEWIWSPQILKMFAKNKDGETIPDEIIDKLLKSRSFGVGMFNQQQMFYAATSLYFHNQHTAEFNQLELLKKLQQQFSPYAYVDGTHMHLSFGHLKDYASTYYTYTWSEVIAKDIFNEFRRQGLLNGDIAMKYRKAILEPGGSQKASDLVQSFLNRNYSFSAFEQYLNGDDKGNS